MPPVIQNVRIQKMNKPIIRIFVAIAVLFLFVEILFYFQTGGIGASLLIFLGFWLGPIMALDNPNNLSFAIFYSIILAASIIGLTIGFRNRKYIWGQVLTVSGIVIWAICGIFGMGQGF